MGFFGIKEIEGRLFFSILGIDSDNGVEFVNDYLILYYEEHKVTFGFYKVSYYPKYR
jgi:hypothetical protein